MSSQPEATEDTPRPPQPPRRRKGGGTRPWTHLWAIRREWSFIFGKPPTWHELSSLRSAVLEPAQISADLSNDDLLTSSLAEKKGVLITLLQFAGWISLLPLANRFSNTSFFVVTATIPTTTLRAAPPHPLPSNLTLLPVSCPDHRIRELLSQGHVVVYCADATHQRHPLAVPVLSRLAPCCPLPEIAADLQCPVLGCAPEREEKLNQWRLEKIALPSSGSPGTATAAVMSWVSEKIRALPLQWSWGNDFWHLRRPTFLLASRTSGWCLPDQAEIKKFRIVVRAPNWLGDAIMHLSAVRALKNGRHDTHLTVLCPSHLADLYRACPFVDAVLDFPKKSSLLRVATQIRESGFDLAVLAPHSWRTALEAWLGGVPARAGTTRRGRCWPAITHPASNLLSHGRDRHQALSWLRTIHLWGGAADRSPACLPHEAATPSYGVIAPGAEYGPAKRWNPTRFAESAQALSLRITRWIIVGARGDQAACTAVAEAVQGAENQCGNTTLTELMTLLRGASLCLGNDSGVMHLAAFCGVPTVAVFGSTEPRSTAPFNGGTAIVRKQTACSPCFRRTCPFGHYRCLDSVQAADVAAAAERLLDGQTPAPVTGLAWHGAVR